MHVFSKHVQKKRSNHLFHLFHNRCNNNLWNNFWKILPTITNYYPNSNDFIVKKKKKKKIIERLVNNVNTEFGERSERISFKQTAFLLVEIASWEREREKRRSTCVFNGLEIITLKKKEKTIAIIPAAFSNHFFRPTGIRSNKRERWYYTRGFEYLNA